MKKSGSWSLSECVQGLKQSENSLVWDNILKILPDTLPTSEKTVLPFLKKHNARHTLILIPTEFRKMLDSLRRFRNWLSHLSAIRGGNRTLPSRAL
jgi:hypothetical protein